MNGLTGGWHLSGFAQASSEAGLIGDDSDPKDIDAWLNGGGDGLIAQAHEVAGLELVIGADGRFTERCLGAAPAISWFDITGVMTEEALPFSGEFVDAEEGAIFFRPDTIASWAVPVAGRHGTAVLRYDDGDTKIVDMATVAGDRLLRTVNVVTDELYLNRLALVYSRATV